PGQLDRFEADRYRSPYLKQAIVRKHDDSISTQVRYWQRQATAGAAEAMETLAELVEGRVQGSGDRGQETGRRSETSVLSTKYSVLSTRQTEEAPPGQIDVRLDAARDHLAAALTSANPA